jgi:hypothetical protein
VPDGQDPYDQCSDVGASACGTDGTCNGAGACRLYAAGTLCARSTCTGTNFVGARTCNGSGTCLPPTQTSCGKILCDAAGSACRPTCATNADCAPPNVCHEGACGGLRAHYFADETLTTMVLDRVDPRIDFDWMAGGPAPNLPVDSFTVRWTGKLTPRFSETYRLTAGSDDGVRVWVDGALLIDEWIGRPYAEGSAAIALMAGRAYDLKVEFVEYTSNSAVRFFWESPSQPRQIVPASALTPAP